MLAKAMSALSGEQNRPGGLPCVVVHGGQDVALLLVAREGRFPASVTLMNEPIIGWVCSDGTHEHVDMSGPSGAADFRALTLQCQTVGLLVGEVGEIDLPDVDAASFYVMHPVGHEPDDGQGATRGTIPC